MVERESNKITNFLIKEIAGGLAFGILFSSPVWMVFECIQGPIKETPIQVITKDKKGRPLDYNKDGLGDRLLESKAGIKQKQFGYKNLRTGELEYLTKEQLRERIEGELERKYGVR